MSEGLVLSHLISMKFLRCANYIILIYLKKNTYFVNFYNKLSLNFNCKIKKDCENVLQYKENILCQREHLVTIEMSEGFTLSHLIPITYLRCDSYINLINKKKCTY